MKISFCATVFIVACLCSSLQANGDLIHQWTFNDANDGHGGAKDYVGAAHGTLIGAPTVSGGRITFNGSTQYVATGNTAQTLNAITLVVWLTNNNTPAGGGALSIQHGVNTFNSITYGERTPNQWMNGSNGWARSPANNGGAVETSTEQIMMAITYNSATFPGTGPITLYRNGVHYATTGPYAQITFNNPRFFIGLRFINDTIPGGYYAGSVDEARVYNTTLNADEIMAIYQAGPVPIPEPASFAAAPLGMFGLLQLIHRHKRRRRGMDWAFARLDETG